MAPNLQIMLKEAGRFGAGNTASALTTATCSEAALAKIKRVCSIENCDNPHYGRGLCQMHYQRSKRGFPLDAPAPTPPGSTQGFIEAVVSKGTWPVECIPWPFALNVYGYPVGRYEGKNHRVNRLVCRLVHGEPDDPSLHAAHSCGNRWCINPSHLRWASAQENVADKVIHGTTLYGERNTSASLTAPLVLEIRRRFAAGETPLAIAASLGMPKSRIYRVTQGKTWGWLQ